MGSFTVMFIGVVINYFAPEEAFIYLASGNTITSILAWSMILVAHLGFRRKVLAGELPASTLRMPWAPYSNYVTLTFMAFVVVLLAFDETTRIALFVAPVFAALVAIGHFATRHKAIVQIIETADGERLETT